MQETIAFQMMILYRDFLAYTTDTLKALGLSFGLMPFVLYTGKHPGCTQAELTRKLQLDWGYSQRSIAKLVDAGFLRKEYDQAEACNRLTLTEAGNHMFAVSHGVFASWDGEKTQVLSQDEQELLLHLLQKLTRSSKERNR